MPVSILRMRFIASFLLFAFIVLELTAQPGRRRRDKSDEWPPERAYSRISLGYALQGVFQRHYDFCGFPTSSGKRDYTPPTLERFLGRRTLRTRVEQANLSGANMLAYVFGADELERPLDRMDFVATRVLLPTAAANTFGPQPKEGFDSFVMTRNCSGYLKACLDAGIEPPYAAFAAALNTDDRRESSVLSVAGTFVSPLAKLLAERSDATTDLMSRLWLFYQDNPEYDGAAYYLREFEGIMVRHLTEAEAIMQAERRLGVNVTLPLAARFRAELEQGRGASLQFGGTDWETIVYADFGRETDRLEWFEPLPNSTEIARYFASLNASYSASEENSVLSEGSPHRHQLRLSGVPAELARMPWRLERVTEGVYRDGPELTYDYYEEGEGRHGVVFTITGVPDRKLFRNRKRDRQQTATLDYRLTLAGRGGMPLVIGTRQEIATSLHPSLNVVRRAFDLSKRDNQRYAFEWEIEIQVEDADNPLDFERMAQLSLQSVQNAATELAVRPESVTFDRRRHSLLVKVATAESWPLQRINDARMRDFNLAGELQLPLQRGRDLAIRPLRAVIAVPEILPLAEESFVAPPDPDE